MLLSVKMVIDRLRLRRGQHLLQLLPAGGTDGRKRAEAAQELIAALFPDAGDGVEPRTWRLRRVR